MTSKTSNPPSKSITKRAVIDIGSNSVRLVIYDGFARSKFAICNERALCSLGRFADDGEKKLDPDSVTRALTELTRFRRILAEHGDPPLSAIATAAIRDASDGDSFIKKVEKLGMDVKILSGDEEAKLAALGVRYFEPTAQGVVGDMGGGSLELANIDDGKVGTCTSYALGPLSIARRLAEKKSSPSALIKSDFSKLKLPNGKNPRTLYVVGGAWRALARIHMNLRNYPLAVLHHYEMSLAEAIDVCELVSGLSRRSLEEIPGVSRRRIDTLPIAALVLKKLMERLEPKEIVVSAAGIREGLLYQELTRGERDIDPCIEGAWFFAQQMSPQPKFGGVALKVIKPLFPDLDDEENRLLRVASTMIDISAYMHPDLRAQYAFDMVMRAPFTAMSHKERVWVAMALYQRYKAGLLTRADNPALGILRWREQKLAHRVGLAMRFAASFSPKAMAPLKHCRLSIDDDTLVFSAPADRREMMSETPLKRLSSLADAFDMEFVLAFDDDRK